MAVRKVAVMGHPILRKVAAPIPVDKITSGPVQQLIQDMTETMVEYNGQGLAAPQVHESVQIILVFWNFDQKKDPALACFINPELEFLTKETQSYWEGCLSVPGLRGKVARPSKLRLKAFDQEAEPVEMTLEGYPATVIQHEYDHLIGKLYLDRMTDFSLLTFENEYRRFHAES